MKKLLLLLFALSIYSAMSAQILKERRVYYLDCSFSMGPIWEKVCDNLKNAIDNVEDQTTELIVLPFAKDSQHHSSFQACVATATAAGKQKLINFINGLNCKNRNTMTYHGDALRDFCNNGRVALAKVTYMFFMTDGRDDDPDNPKLFDRIVKNNWTRNYGNVNVYGFYVMLANPARDANRERLITSAEHFWVVNSANVNINLVRLQNKAVFNARNDKYFDIPVYGDAKVIVASFEPSSPLQVQKVELKSDSQPYLRVHVKVKGNPHNLPVKSKCKLKLKMPKAGTFDFLVTDVVNVSCLNKKERSLNITVR